MKLSYSIFTYICIALASYAALSLSHAADQGSADTRQPNVLLILTDDQGYGDLSLHGNPQLRTPAMDRLGRQSLRLDRFYVNPVCGPTRASLLTGRYHLRTGASGVTRRQEVLNPEEVTIAELLQENGYATACFGKWHNGSVYPETPNGQGFDEFLGILGGLSQLYFDPILNHNGEAKQYKGYITEILAEASIQWMEQQIESDKPFFCYVPFNAPHTPGLVEDQYWKTYYDKRIGRWEAVTYGMIKVIDQEVGRMLDFLESKNQADNTIVIFMSDNGPATWRYNAGLRGKKGHVFDGGIRVPCFIRWPSKLEPNTIKSPLAHIDILPTLADWCRIPQTSSLELDGLSFAELSENPNATLPDRNLIAFTHGDRERVSSSGSVHNNRWSAVQRNGDWSLYDIKSDIRQINDLSKTHPDALQELKAHFEATLSTMPPLGLIAPYPLRDNGRGPVILEAQDALLPKQYKGKGIDYNFPAGFSHHWISSWTDANAVPEWKLDVIDPGKFEVTLRYCVKERDLGVAGHLIVQDKRLPISITEAFDPPSTPQPFLLEGEAKKYEHKTWKDLRLGSVSLERGSTTLRIQITDIPGKEAMEIKDVVIARL
ncbi:MAG: arylsulfatase [Verrucomicrobiota bacterium]